MRKGGLGLGLLALLALAGGCTTTAEPVAQSPASSQYRSQEPAPGTGPVRVGRDRSMIGAACATNLYVNEGLAARVGNGQVATLYLPPGLVLLRVEPQGMCSGALVDRQAALTLGQPATFRVGPDRSGGVAIRPVPTS